jgi:hypothetical protein
MNIQPQSAIVSRVSREIDGKGRTVRELLANRKCSIDYYQREYKWQHKQVSELIEDLAAKFPESYEEGDERSAVGDYDHYFLGSVIISDKDGQKFIIDGQQRLTTLTLLLIYLHHRLEDPEQKGQIADLIFAQRFGKRSFNLDVPERRPAWKQSTKARNSPRLICPNLLRMFLLVTRISKIYFRTRSKGEFCPTSWTG